MTLDLTGRVAIVTGGANGIGLAIARALGGAGAEVWVLDLETAAEFGERSLHADVTDRASLEAAFTRVGDPDIVVANAGTVIFEELTETRIESWRRVLEINLTGTFHTVQLAAARMKARRRGSIVVTASTNSFDGEASLAAYNSSKAGLVGLVRTAANELGPYNVRVNAVCPGTIRTRLTRPYYSRPEVLKDYFRQIPMGRGGEPEEVAGAVLFLASELASYVTGVTLLVDGGQLAAKFAPWNEDSASFEGDRWRLR